jgi:nucleotide-binding universal stress UspA family protein
VVAAVDPFHAHARPADLDARLLETGGAMARLLHGSLQVFHAYRPLVTVQPVVAAAAPLVMLPLEAEDAHAQQVMHVIGELADEAGISRRRCHIRMGEVADELNAFARRTGTAIVVMGAVSRSAIKRFFIGNARRAHPRSAQLRRARRETARLQVRRRARPRGYRHAKARPCTPATLARHNRRGAAAVSVKLRA